MWKGKRVILACLAGAVLLGLVWWQSWGRYWRPLPSAITPEARAAVHAARPPAGTTRADAKGVEQVWVPPGWFRRGCDPARDGDANWYETPEHDCHITRGFWIDKYEVTNAAYERFVADGGYTQRAWWSEEGWTWKGERMRPDDSPVEMRAANLPRVWVSWYEAEAYARWRGGRLPTEAEWEYAARGPESPIYPWGDRWDAGRANSQENGLDRILPVDSYVESRSWCGALNLAGNAWEWIADWFDPKAYRLALREDPQGPAAGTERVIRGGSWKSPATSVRSARRSHPVPSHRSISMGFRIVTPSSASE